MSCQHYISYRQKFYRNGNRLMDSVFRTYKGLYPLKAFSILPEQIRNAGVVGSNPIGGTISFKMQLRLPEFFMLECHKMIALRI